MALTAAPVVICFLSFFFYISETILLNRLIIHADDMLTESIIGEPVKPRTVPFQPRDFIHNPITNEEHRLLAQRYEAQYAHKNGTHPRIALCHPTIHKGDKQSWDALLNPIFAMISYYRLLGVSHIFAWYEPNVAEKAARWDELINTTSEFTTFVPLEDVDEDEHYHGQNIVMKHCIKNYAKDYDWILINDADEFFWWSKKGSLIDFVEAYSNYSYISLGKYMYSMIHQYQPLHEEWPVQNFGVEMHPFTPGSYCYQKNGTSMCPAFVGRCKLIIRPFEYQRGEVSIHGKPYRLKMSGTIHLDTSVAHWKEWVSGKDAAM